MSEDGIRKDRIRVPEWLAELGLKEGEYFTDGKPRWQRALKSNCFNETARIYAFLSLHTAAFKSEKAVKLEAGKLVPCSVVDAAAAARVKKQNVRRAMLELRRWGLGDIQGLIKGSVELYLWQRPRPAEAENGNRANYHLEGFPPSLKPFISLFKRWKITPPHGTVTSLDYQKAVESAARDYQNAEMVLKRTLKGNLATETRNEEERNESNFERNTPDGRTVLEAGATPAPPSAHPPARREANKEEALKIRLRAWLLEHFRKPLAPDDQVLNPIIEAIRDEEGFSQFCEAARDANPKQGWKVFVSVARKCAAHRPDYAKAQLAGIGAETEAERFAREYRARHETT